MARRTKKVEPERRYEELPVIGCGAFAAVLTVQVDEPTTVGGGGKLGLGRLGACVGDEDFAPTDLVRVVHVMSKPAGGEIRGYVLDAQGGLRLRLPAYAGDWPELDRAIVESLAGYRARLVPHVFTPSHGSGWAVKKAP